MSYQDQRDIYVDAHRAVLREVFDRQQQIVTSNWQQSGSMAVGAIFSRQIWDRQLADQLYLRNRLTALDFGREIADQLNGVLNAVDLDAFLLKNADVGASLINLATENSLQEALLQSEIEPALASVFEQLLGERLDMYASTTVGTSANFGMVKAGETNDAKGKMWEVNSRNPRPAHAMMAGETVGLYEEFSNGMQWPGDPSGGADEVANCACSVGILP